MPAPRRSWRSMPPRRRSVAAAPAAIASPRVVTVSVMSGMSWIRSVGDRVLARLARIGADPQDDDDTRAGKALLVLISVLILPVALLWAILYLAFGSPVGWVPLGYFAILLAAIVVFSRTRDFGRFLLVGQVAILFAPTLSMIPLGGFLDSGGVGLWGILAPLGALVFNDVRTAARWYVAYVIVFLGSGIAGELLGGVSPAVPEWFTSTMLALNVTVGGAIVFTLLARVREPAPGRARGAARGASESGEPAAQHPAAIDRRPAQGRDPDDRGPVQLGVDPVRRRRRLHAALGAPAAGRGRRPARPPVQPLRRARRALRAREDQDDRRLLHGRRGRPVAAPRPRPRPRADGARHAGGDALGRRGRPPRARVARRDQLGPGRGRGHRPQAVPVRPLG